MKVLFGIVFFHVLENWLDQVLQADFALGIGGIPEQKINGPDYSKA